MQTRLRNFEIIERSIGNAGSWQDKSQWRKRVSHEKVGTFSRLALYPHNKNDINPNSRITTLHAEIIGIGTFHLCADCDLECRIIYRIKSIVGS